MSHNYLQSTMSTYYRRWLLLLVIVVAKLVYALEKHYFRETAVLWQLSIRDYCYFEVQKVIFPRFLLTKEGIWILSKLG